MECAWVRGFEKFEGTIVALNVLGKCAWKIRGSVGGKFLDVRECGLRKVLEIKCEGAAWNVRGRCVGGRGYGL